LHAPSVKFLLYFHIKLYNTATNFYCGLTGCFFLQNNLSMVDTLRI